jgi:hypothetical protein
MARKTLTGKQKIFAEHYVVSFNASDAARKAGYAEATVAVKGHENLQIPHVREYIEELLKESREHLAITKEQIIGDLMSIKAKHIDNDPRVAIQALGEINKMLGYYEAQKTETKIITEQPLLPGIEDIKFIDVTTQKELPEGNE